MGSSLLLFLMLHVLVYSRLFLTGAAQGGGGTVLYYDFVVKEANFSKLCSSKSILTVNGSFPGPEIHAARGDTVFVTIHNQGTYGITIHWHGVKQPRNPWSDGPENITQCPIPPGTNFTQEISLSNEEGTLWWHAHSDWSRATLHGAIIIRPPPHRSYPFIKPHQEEVLVLGSWYRKDVMEVIQRALASGSDPNVSDAYTINGQPGDTYPCSNENMYRLKVGHGKTYLLRIINSVLNTEMFFGIAHHNLTVVGTDAAYVKPLTVSFLTIAPGQTMDVLVTAAEQTLSNNNKYYYIVASPFADTTAKFNNHSTTGILDYEAVNDTPIDHPHPPPSSIPFPILPIYNDSAAAASFTAKLRSLASAEYPVNVPRNVTRRILMTIAVNTLSCPNNSCSGPFGGRLSASLNNISFVTPSVDILQSYYHNRVEMQRLQRHNKDSRSRFPNPVTFFYQLLIKMTGQKLIDRNSSNTSVFATDFPDKPPSYFDFTGDVDNITMYTSEGTKVIMLDYGEPVEIVFQGTNLTAAENHPMHLHGLNIYLVGTGTGNFDPAIDPQRYNLLDPPQVNTVGVPKNGWLAIRFFADNPGVWFLHCHLERHMSWGMRTVIIVKDGGSAETSIRPPPPYMPPCSPKS